MKRMVMIVVLILAMLGAVSAQYKSGLPFTSLDEMFSPEQRTLILKRCNEVPCFMITEDAVKHLYASGVAEGREQCTRPQI